jgi:hypothetical protein
MNVRLRPESDNLELDASSSGRAGLHGGENVIRWCAIAVALTLAGFFGAYLMK